MPDAGTPRPTTSEWIDRLSPALGESVRDAGDAITNTPVIQSWLHTASFETAMGMEGTGDMQAAAEAHSRMLDDLTEQFPELVEAVRSLTGGCGRLNLHWRPLSPQYSRVYVDFRLDADVQVLIALEDATEEAVHRALERLASHLPASEPFPRRPHEVTGLIPYEDHCLLVRMREHNAGDGTRRRTVTVQPTSDLKSEPLDPHDAARALVTYLREAT